MALQNIGASNKDDAFYRYKMPKLISKIEGRGNGIKTNLVNMVDVAKALARPPSYTTKFFGCELGAQSKFDEKTGTSTVNGAHDNVKLLALLETFISKYVQCYGCRNPETEILISRSQMITMKCAACGFISDVDMRDKLTTFILKNPPEQKKGGKDKKAAKKAEKDKAKEESRKKKGHDEPLVKKKVTPSDEEQSPPASQFDENEPSKVDDDEVQWQTDTSAVAAQQRIEELSAATRGMVMVEDAALVAENGSKKNSKGKKSLDKNNSSQENVKKMQELSLHDGLLKEFQICVRDGFSAAQLASKFQSKKDDGEVAMVAYFASLFGDISKGLAREVEKKRLYLAKVVVDEQTQSWLLKALEAFCTSKADLSKEVPLVLKYLYDLDVLEEEQILKWYDNGVANAVDTEAELLWKSSKPFIVWLRTAESESEDES